MNREEFRKELEKINIVLSSVQLEQLETYKNLLIEYNQHTNLTAIKTEKEIYLKHFYDSLTMNEYIKDKQEILDIGTGAGFPGMVLAIANPNSKFVLLDSNNKKIQFLQYLNEHLQLSNVECVHMRAEEYVHQNLERFDIVTSRAVADLRILTELSIPACKINGLFIPMKSNLEEELQNANETLDVLKGKIIAKKEFSLPYENSRRTILVIQHREKTDKMYPRVYDKILKKPLKKNLK